MKICQVLKDKHRSPDCFRECLFGGKNNETTGENRLDYRVIAEIQLGRRVSEEFITALALIVTADAAFHGKSNLDYLAGVAIIGARVLDRCGVK